MPKKYPLVPFRDPLEGISTENAEEIVRMALSNCPGTPLYIKPQNIITSRDLLKGRRRLHQKQTIKIEQIGSELR